jgi:hypothetical protein
MQIDIQSGPALILASGTVFSFLGHPLEMFVGGIRVVFQLVNDSSGEDGIRHTSNQTENSILIELVNLRTAQSTVSAGPIGEVEFYPDEGKPRWDKLYLNFAFTPGAKEPGSDFKIEYTFYAVMKP